MRHDKDLIEIANMLDGFHASFSRLCEQQSRITKSYNRLAELWSDKVYSITGECLTEVSMAADRVYSEFSDMARRLGEEHSRLCDYQELDEARSYPELEFPKDILWEENGVNKGHIRVDPEDIKQFEVSLASYLDELGSIERDVAAKYAEAADFWRDEQYGRFGDAVNEFTHGISRETDKLSTLSLLLARKREILEKEVGSI